MRRPRLLDLYCGAGGAAMGYHRAGFDVIGVDIVDQPDYPFEFVRLHALHPMIDYTVFDFVHASPPCQDLIAITAGNRKRPGWADTHVNLVPHTRKRLADSGVPYVIECGVGKHLRRDLSLCGEMFGLGVIRHRWFEFGGPIESIPAPVHRPHRGRVAGWRHGKYFDGPYLAVYGDGGGKGSTSQWQLAMGIDWTDDRRSLAEAIPAAYTEHIGRRLLGQLAAATA